MEIIIGGTSGRKNGIASGLIEAAKRVVESQ
jgi:hypothetical protein